MRIFLRKKNIVNCPRAAQASCQCCQRVFPALFLRSRDDALNVMGREGREMFGLCPQYFWTIPRWRKKIKLTLCHRTNTVQISHYFRYWALKINQLGHPVALLFRALLLTWKHSLKMSSKVSLTGRRLSRPGVLKRSYPVAVEPLAVSGYPFRFSSHVYCKRYLFP